MTAKSIIPRRCRSVVLTDEEHRKFHDLGGSAWLQRAIPKAWGKLPADARKWKPFAPQADWPLGMAWRTRE